MEKLSTHFLELIRRASTVLPADVERALRQAVAREGADSSAGSTLTKMLENAEQARETSAPICQDTGTLILYVDYGPDLKMADIRRAVHEAAAEATAKYYLRPNAVDPLTGKNSGNNVGIGAPYIHFEELGDPGLKVRLMLKGGGSENVGAQFKLPDASLGAGRDLGGVRRCVLEAVFQAQGKGCGPGTVGVGIGGDRGSSFIESKEQLFRPLEDRNPDPDLAPLEERLHGELNTLGIGPMGFGGNPTVLGVKIGKRHRHPACYFVSVSYICWAYRRASMTIKEGKVSYD
jgi:fumarate hydratase class I